MRTSKLLSVRSLPHLQNLHCEPIKPLLLLLSFSTHTFAPTQTSNPVPIENPNPLVINYLIQTFGFSKNQAITTHKRLHWSNFPEKPQSVISYLRKVGFTEAQIRYSVKRLPAVLFMNVEKNLRPKFEYFQELGFVGSDLGKFISADSTILNFSLSRSLIPRIQIIKNLLVSDHNNENLIRVLRRRSILIIWKPQSRFLCNVAFLKSCGISGSLLSNLLVKQPQIFMMKDSKVKELVSRALDMGFSVDSGMVVHALRIVSGISDGTFRRKIELFQSFGFTEDECMRMIRIDPALLLTSEEKLKLGIEFFMNKLGYDKSSLIGHPTCLNFSYNNRVIPRYRVFQVIMSKKLLKKEPSFTSMLILTETKFVEKFISRFKEDAEELSVTYNGRLLDSANE